MNEQREKTIFYFDDDVDCIQEVVSALREQYEITLAAHWPVIRVERKVLFDLVIIDLMIHHSSLDEAGREVENISYKDKDKDIPWQRTGVEFLRRIRLGEYEEYGFSKDVKVIIASAVVDHEAKEGTQALTISSYIEKPFTIEEIQQAIQKVIG